MAAPIANPVTTSGSRPPTIVTFAAEPQAPRSTSQGTHLASQPRWSSQSRPTTLGTVEFLDPIDNATSLKDLLSSLIDSEVPGPQLYRLRKEFNIIEEGGQSEIYGVGKSVQDVLARATRDGQMAQTDWPVDKIVIKRHRPRKTSSIPSSYRSGSSTLGTHERGSSGMTSYELGSNFLAARREILALAPSRFRGTPNIVQIKGWGLCLDTLEDKAPHQDAIQMPLLILERANCDLDAFLRVPYGASNSHLLGLCRDIGNGLAALHDEGFTHGDLKPKNVLIFQTLTGWTAKLCDFGCAWQKLEDDDSDNTSPSSPSGQRPRPKYIGTVGWKPPEAASDSTAGFSHDSLKLCDAYVFGLVVWSVFCKSGQSPISESDDIGLSTDPHKALKQAGSDIKMKPKFGIYTDTLSKVLEAALKPPDDRDPRPWVHLLQPVTLKSFAIRFTQSVLSHVGWASTLIPTNSEQPQQFVPQITGRLQSEQSCVKPPLLPIEKSEVTSRLSSDVSVEPIISDLTHDPSQGPSTIMIRRGDTFSDKSTAKLYEAFVSCFQGDVEPKQLYEYARTRFDVSLTLWNAVHPDKKANFIARALMLEPAVDIVTLAWLCRGEIGAWEVKNLQPNFETWGAMLRTDFLNESERLERFLLLLQSGARVEALMPVSPEWDDPVERTILFEYIRSCRKATLDAVMNAICSQFSEALVLPETRIGESTKAYFYPAAGQTKSALQDFVTEVYPLAVKHLFDQEISSSIDTSEPEAIAKSKGEYKSDFVRDASQIMEQFSRLTRRARPIGMVPPTTLERDQRTESGWVIRRARNSSGLTSMLASYLVSPSVPRIWRTGPSKDIYYNPKSQSYTTFPPSAGFSTGTVVLIGYIHPDRAAHSVNVTNFLPTIGQGTNLGTTRFPLYIDEWYKEESQLLWPPPKDPLGEIQESWTIPSFADRVDHQLLSMLTWKILKTTPVVLIVAGLRLIPLLLLLREN